MSYKSIQDVEKLIERSSLEPIVKEAFLTVTKVPYKNLGNLYWRLSQILKLFENKGKKDITWDYICSFSNYIKRHGTGALVRIVLHLAKNNYFEPLNKKIINLLSGLLEFGFHQRLRSANLLFCYGLIEHLYIFRFKTSRRIVIKLVFQKNDNEFLIKVLSSYYHRIVGLNGKIQIIYSILNNDDLSLVQDYNSFTPELFFKLIEQYNDNKEVVRVIIHLFRAIANDIITVNELFQRTHKINIRLLNSNILEKYIINGYSLVPFNSSAEMHNKKMVLLVDGLDKKYSDYTKRDFIKLDLSAVKDDFYAKIIFDYYLKGNVPIFDFHKLTSVVHFFNYITDVKSTTVDKTNINLEDGFYFLNHMLRLYPIKSAEPKLSFIRRVLKWASDNNALNIDNRLFRLYSHLYQVSKNNGENISVSDEDFEKLCSILNKHTTMTWKLLKSIVVIMRTTELRISQLLSIKISDINKTTIIPGMAIIVDKTKTSNGEKTEIPITSLVYKELKRIITLTSGIRSQCHDSSIKDYVFLTKMNNKCVGVMRSKMVSSYLKRACNEAKIPQIRSSNLRKSYMTDVVKYIEKDKKTAALNNMVLSRHVDGKITYDAYLDYREIVELEYLIDLDSSVSSIYPEKQITSNSSSITSKEVFNGFCSQENECCGNGLLPCFMCKSFRTTPAHLPQFIRWQNELEERVSEQASNKNNVHIIEDLQIKRRICLEYIIALKGFIDNE